MDPHSMNNPESKVAQAYVDLIAALGALALGDPAEFDRAIAFRAAIIKSQQAWIKGEPTRKPRAKAEG
jgi:hypothetical protein